MSVSISGEGSVTGIDQGLNVVGVVTATQVKVGSAVTIHSGGFQVGSSDIHSTGLTVNQINATGVITSTSLVVSGVVTSFDFYNTAEYPSVRPTLDLAFAQTKILDSRITFNRSSTATYFNASGIVTTAALNEPRFDHDPATGESLGLLVEEARTNSMLNSNTGNPVYPGSGVSHSTSGVGLDGTTSATQVVITSTQNTTGLRWDGWSTSSTETRSFFVKVLSGSGVTITGQGGSGDGFTWNISTKTYSSDSRHPTGGVYDYGNGWYRCWQGPTGAGGDVGVYMVPVGVGTYLFWGFQRETGSFPTSYIPTTSSTVTRSADVASITGTNFSSWFNPNSSSIYTKYKTDVSGWYAPIYSLNDNGNSNAFWLQGYNSNSWNPYLTGLGNGYFSTTGGGPFSGDNKIALSLETGSFKMAQNGVMNTGVASTNITGPFNAVTRLRFAVSVATGNVAGSLTFARLTYWPTRLPNNVLQTITL